MWRLIPPRVRIALFHFENHDSILGRARTLRGVCASHPASLPTVFIASVVSQNEQFVDVMYQIRCDPEIRALQNRGTPLWPFPCLSVRHDRRARTTTHRTIAKESHRLRVGRRGRSSGIDDHSARARGLCGCRYHGPPRSAEESAFGWVPCSDC